MSAGYVVAGVRRIVTNDPGRQLAHQLLFEVARIVDLLAGYAQLVCSVTISYMGRLGAFAERGNAPTLSQPWPAAKVKAAGFQPLYPRRHGWGVAPRWNDSAPLARRIDLNPRMARQAPVVT